MKNNHISKESLYVIIKNNLKENLYVFIRDIPTNQKQWTKFYKKYDRNIIVRNGYRINKYFGSKYYE